MERHAGRDRQRLRDEETDEGRQRRDTQRHTGTEADTPLSPDTQAQAEDREVITGRDRGSDPETCTESHRDRETHRPRYTETRRPEPVRPTGTRS